MIYVDNLTGCYYDSGYENISNKIVSSAGTNNSIGFAETYHYDIKGKVQASKIPSMVSLLRILNSCYEGVIHECDKKVCKYVIGETEEYFKLVHFVCFDGECEPVLDNRNDAYFHLTYFLNKKDLSVEGIKCINIGIDAEKKLEGAILDCAIFDSFLDCIDFEGVQDLFGKERPVFGKHLDRVQEGVVAVFKDLSKLSKSGLFSGDIDFIEVMPCSASKRGMWGYSYKDGFDLCTDSSKVIIGTADVSDITRKGVNSYVYEKFKGNLGVCFAIKN